MPAKDEKKLVSVNASSLGQNIAVQFIVVRKKLESAIERERKREREHGIQVAFKLAT